jgi:uncharacterized repeat protein (TIGR01451 family)
MKKIAILVFLGFISSVTFAIGHTVSISHTNAQCNGSCNGSATAVVSGGTGPFSYDWTPGNPAGDGTNYIYNLCAGTYTLTVTDNSDMSTTIDSVVILQPVPVVVSLLSFHTICAGGCVTLNTSTSGGTTPYSYNWVSSTGLSSTTVPNPVCCPPYGMSYTVTVRDANLCTGTAVTIVSITPAPTVTISTTPAYCSACDGTATVNFSGGAPPYTFLGTPGVWGSGSGATNLCAGTYTVTATDANGCSATSTTVVGMTSSISNFYTSVNSSFCAIPNGSITVDSIAGGVSPFTYKLGTGAWGSSATFTSLPPGTYYVGVKDSNGCIAYQSITVNALNAPVITLDSIIDIGCSSLGGIFISVTGGSPPYSYTWGGSITTQDLFNISSPGSYNIHVVDAGGCSSNAAFTVVTLSTLHGTVYSTHGNCTTLPTATATAYGGVPPYTYLWNTTPAQTTPTITNLANGNYNCIITDSTGCTRTVYVSAFQHCYNVVKGRIYNDLNGNCNQDAGEAGIVGRAVYTTSGGGYAFTNLMGDYTMLVSNMMNTVTHANPLYSTVICPSGNMQPANFTTLGDTVYNVNFAVQITPGINDLYISYYPGVARPGFSQTGYIWYKNVGTTIISGINISLTHDSILTFNASFPASASYTYPVIGWNIGTLNPGQTGYIYTNFSVPVISSGGYIGRVLNYSAQINPLAGDSTPVNNTANSNIAITGSWDPNEKEVSPAGNILATDSILTYRIQFQNTGTDTAFTIVLKDMLSAFLDPATVEPGIASHPYTFDIGLNGELTWTFNNILLVDSTTNEPASHGFATFTVKQRQNNPLGTQIDNTAYIYFDFNEAVVTNTVSNNIVDVTTGIETASTNNIIKVYPNPFNENTTFIIQSDKINELYLFEMTDVLGKKVKQLKTSEKQFNITRTGLESGIYFYNITNAAGVVGKGKIIIK